MKDLPPLPDNWGANILTRLSSRGLSAAEIIGRHREKAIVRVYTDEKGWQYEKVDAADDTAIDAFAAKVSRKVVK